MKVASRMICGIFPLLVVACGSPEERSPAPRSGIHWDSAEGVLSVRQHRQTTTMRFVRVDPGNFRMGVGDCGRTVLIEGPPRTVRIGAAFWLAATETTRGQWHALSGEPPPPDPLLPMTRVSWTAIQTFIQELNQQTGAAFRLPTEAEWEFACRAGSSTPWPWKGDRRQLSRFGWYLGNAGSRLHPVAGKEANPLGLFDMNGNAVEWTQDTSGPANRVLRGGLVLSPANATKCTCRFHFPAAYGYQFAGFRLAADCSSR